MAQNPGRGRLKIESRVGSVNIPTVQLFPKQLAGFAKSLEMNDLPLPEKFDYVVHIRIVTEP